MATTLFTDKQLSEVLFDPLKIAEALYSINKEAKRQRDIRLKFSEMIYGEWNRYKEEYDDSYEQEEDGYDYVRYKPRLGTSLQHYHLQNAKQEKTWLYSMKERALEMIEEKFDIKPKGYHYFPLDDQYRDIYVIGTFSFHTIHCSVGTCFGAIDQMMESDKRKSMSLKRAIRLINAFISE